jgi:MFS-type transporter involved in bile tolerance (Atg22 family)
MEPLGKLGSVCMSVSQVGSRSIVRSLFEQILQKMRRFKSAGLFSNTGRWEDVVGSLTLRKLVTLVTQA